MKQTCLKSAAVLLSLTVAAVIGEIVIRSLHPELIGKWSERGKFYVYDSLLGWKGKPKARGIFERKDFKHAVRHNDRGFRGKNYPYSGMPDFSRILVLGDSYVWGYGVEEHEIFTALMEDSLKQTEVINLGCSGYGNDQELLLLKEEGVKYHPDLIVVVVTLPSDFLNNTHSVQYSCPKPYFLHDQGILRLHNVPVPRRNVVQSIGSFLTRKSALYVYLKFLTPSSKKINSEEVPVTFDLLKEIRDLCHGDGIESLFVINPAKESKAEGFYRSEKSIRLFQLMESDRFHVIDLYGPLMAHAGNHEKLVFESDAHWNKNGHQWVASIILKNLNLTESALPVSCRGAGE